MCRMHQFEHPPEAKAKRRVTFDLAGSLHEKLVDTAIIQ